MNTFFLDRLNSEPHALAFAGQSTPWPVALADQSAESGARRGPAHPCGRRAGDCCIPVSADLLATTGRPVDLFGFEPNPARLGAAAAASAQRSRHRADPAGRAARRSPHSATIRPRPSRSRVLGHSQGVLAVHMVQAIVRSRFHRRSRSQDRRDSCDRNADRRRRHPSGTPARSRRTPRRGDPDAVRQGHHPRPGGRADRTRRRRTWPDRRGRHQFRHALRAVRLPGGPGRIRRGSRQGTQASGQAARREGAWRPRVRPDARIPRRDPAVPQPADGRCRLPGRRMGRGLRHQRRPRP